MEGKVRSCSGTDINPNLSKTLKQKLKKKTWNRRNIISDDALVFTDASFLCPRGEPYGEFRQYCEPQHILSTATM